MATTIATVTPEGLVLPADFMAEFNLMPGTQITITLGDQSRQVITAAEDLDRLCGIFSSTPGLAEELQQERRNDAW